MTRSSWCVALLLLLLALLSTRSVAAHESRPAFLQLEQTSEDTWALTWKVPGRSQEQRLALDVRLSRDCELLALPERSYAEGAFIERSHVRRPGGLAGASIHIEGLSHTLTDVLVRIEHQDGHVQLTRLTPDAPSMIVAARATTGEVARTYLRLGVEHILGGIDHLLFIACLLLITGVGRKLVLTITGFTLAHSLTLALASLDLVHVPIPPVEATIALSIVFVALEIARGDENSLSYRYPVAVSSSFGLLHGFGFAAVLREVGLPPTEIPTSLLFFNVGVELGQLAFVGALVLGFGLIRVVAKPRAEQIDRLRRPAAYIFGAIAVFWVIQRVASFQAP